jgi:hypothetical protein
MGEPQTKPSKVVCGSRFWRWTVLRHAGPELRSWGTKTLYQRRLRVRCACGLERTAWERDLVKGLSTGCPSVRCRRAFDEAIMSKIQAAAETITDRLARLHVEVLKEAENLRALHAESLLILEQSKNRQRRR